MMAPTGNLLDRSGVQVDRRRAAGCLPRPEHQYPRHQQRPVARPFQTSASDNPPAYFMLVDKARVAVLGSSRPWMLTQKMSKSELVYYTARDGLKIPAILTPPVGWNENSQPGPAIVLPHGGPGPVTMPAGTPRAGHSSSRRAAIPCFSRSIAARQAGAANSGSPATTSGA